MKCSGENVILRGIVQVVSAFPLHFMLYRGNLDSFFEQGKLQRVAVPWVRIRHLPDHCVILLKNELVVYKE